MITGGAGILFGKMARQLKRVRRMISLFDRYGTKAATLAKYLNAKD